MYVRKCLFLSCMCLQPILNLFMEIWVNNNTKKMSRKKEIKALSRNNALLKSPIPLMINVLAANRMKSMIYHRINVHLVKMAMNTIMIVILVFLKPSTTIQQDKTIMVRFLQMILRLVLVLLICPFLMEKNVLNVNYLDTLTSIENLVNNVRKISYLI